MNGNISRIKELVEILNKAGKSYYSEGHEIMPNFEYDRLYDELVELENLTGCVLSNSPTINVGYEVLSELPKEKHESPMLSLDKTKNVDTIESWLGNQQGILSWKLDGLTVVITYENGIMQKAVTRGNGEIGEVITNNAKVFKNLPVTIPYKGQLVIRGEALITYSDFDRINELIPEEAAKYKNPRNLCSGSVRQLNNKVTAERNVNLYAFTLVSADGVEFNNSRKEQLDWLTQQGFTTVGYKMVNHENLKDTVLLFEKSIASNDFPSDGLVIMYDDIAYGESLGRTAKFPRNAMAFKWTDETKETTLLEIEWSASRTGLINPIAVFEPVDLEGTQVSRASVHNISIMEELELGVGDTVVVYKANMIIPQIAENLTKSGVKDIPEECPVCHGKTVVSQQNQVKSLYCTNPDCQAKHVGSFEHFVARDAMNIDGLSGATLEKLVQKGIIKKFKDLYHMEEYKEEMIGVAGGDEGIAGFKEKSYLNLINSVEVSRKTTLAKLIYSLGITNIGLANAKMICKQLDNDVEKILNITREEIQNIAGIGDVIADTFVSYFEDENNRNDFMELLKELDIIQEEPSSQGNILEGKIFVLTGSVTHFENRNELKERIESFGGKVSGSVSKNTHYLIAGDAAGSKLTKARDLGVAVITETEFLEMIEK